MSLTIGMITTKGRKLIYGRRWADGFAFGMNLLPKRWGFYLWVIWREAAA
jgi:hypothetical protein